MEKPRYGTSKRHLLLAQALAWVILLAITVGSILNSAGALALAPIAYPSMVGLIAVMLGIHRGLGSLDMWTMTRAASPLPPPPAFHPRDQPGGSP